jgi:hypothetical protein
LRAEGYSTRRGVEGVIPAARHQAGALLTVLSNSNVPSTIHSHPHPMQPSLPAAFDHQKPRAVLVGQVPMVGWLHSCASLQHDRISFSRILCIVCAPLLVSCASTQSVKDLEQIQDTQGVYTKSLYYVGSSVLYHYFDQFTLLGDGWWIPGYEDDGYRTFRVTKDSLTIPTAWEFTHFSYRGKDDSRRIKVRIRSAPTARLEKRVYPNRSLDDYGLKQTGPSTWTIERIQ